MRVLDLCSGLEGWSAAFKARGHDVVTLDIEPGFHPDICADIMQLDPFSFAAKYGYFDVVLASPPCQTFSMASVYHYWKNGEPSNEKTIAGIKLALKTVKLIQYLNPEFYIIENPRGMMRRVLGKPAATVAYCQYGMPYMKPTDMWGRLPPSFVPKMCHPRSKDHAMAPRGSKAEVQGIDGCNHLYAGHPPEGWGKRGGLMGMDCDHLRTGQKSSNVVMKMAKDCGAFAYLTHGHKGAGCGKGGKDMQGSSAALRALIPYQLSLEMCLACERDLA